MKVIQKAAIPPILILLLGAILVCVQPGQAADTPEEPDSVPPAQLRHGSGEMSDEEGMPGAEDDMPRRARRHSRMRAMEEELMAWLEKNEPDIAKSLTELKEKDPGSYRRRLAIEGRKYREIIEAQQTNPELAELLKKDLALKQERNETLEKLKAATNDKEKEALTKELKEIVGKRFDLIIKKKEIKYEELKKKLEQLQERVDKSKAELKSFKDKKDEHINEQLESLISKSNRFDWH
ncbi:MAG: hypothetical protein JW806_05970 [Sedimentisphaerales bacterium]|nr:hypothetical protein [Sedimentisphaerales bacterium]